MWRFPSGYQRRIGVVRSDGNNDAKSCLGDRNKAGDREVTSVDMLGQDKGAVGAMTALRDIHYDFDRYDIRSEDAKILRQDYTWLERNPGVRVRIEGNCDERGTVEYNLALGQKRADAAKSFLVTMGIGKGSLETISYGKEKPVDPGHDEQAWERNRRSHFVPVQ